MPATPLYYATKATAWVVLRLMCGLQVEGQQHVPKTGGCILASNHVSFLDPVVMGTASPRPLSFLARADLFESSILGTYLRGVNVIPLRRGEADAHAIREALRRLRQGDVVAIFPEGGRQRSGHLGRAKRGVGLLATLARVPVLPVFVHGTYQALPPGVNWLRPEKIRVAFGEPILYTDPSLEACSSEGRGRQLQTSIADAVTRQWHQLHAQLQHD